jgi:hypothetical protein
MALTLTFNATPAPHGESLPRRISGTAYTGGIIPAFGSLGDTAIDLSTLAMPGRLVMLNQHNPTARIGWCELQRRGNSLMLTGELSDNPEGLAVRQQLKSGMPLGLSVGVSGLFEPNKRKAIALNGATFSPDTVLKHCRVLEVSTVHAPADPGAMVESFFAKPDPVMPLPDLADIANQNADMLQRIARLKEAARQLRDSAALQTQLSDLELEIYDLLKQRDPSAQLAAFGAVVFSPRLTAIERGLMRLEAVDNLAIDASYRQLAAQMNAGR